MNSAEKAKKLHSKAWKEQKKWKELLLKALEALQYDINQGNYDDDVITNYGAILLDLHRDKEALEFISQHDIKTKEFYANYAIAIAKTDLSNIEKIRSLNKISGQLPTSEYSISAYIDWQGL